MSIHSATIVSAKYCLLIITLFAATTVYVLYNYVPRTQNMDKNYAHNIVNEINKEAYQKTRGYAEKNRSWVVDQVAYSIFLSQSIDQLLFFSVYKTVINLPHGISQANRKLLHDMGIKIALLKNTIEKEALKSKIANLVSEIFQNQLTSLQEPQNCSGINLVCGHGYGCGLGCQLHHRVACTMVSYILGLPLIHDERNWPYSDKWSSVFLPLGSRCTVGKETYRLQLQRDSPYPVLFKESVGTISHKLINGSNIKIFADQIEYPLKKGIPISKELADLVEVIHPLPFLWWVGQFMKFTLRLNTNTMQRIEDAKKEINYTHLIVGCHVRRTDKFHEKNIVKYSTEDYLNVAKEYFSNRSIEVKSAFIASEDATVFSSAEKTYQEWNIIGFKDRVTRKNRKSRIRALFEIVIDLYLLMHSDFVVCSFSSNICGLVYEMQSLIHSDGKSHFHSLDRNYSYVLYGHEIQQQILKINKSD